MSKVYAIKCPNCAAPLDILGGGRVSSVTCNYCHSVLDMNDHYKVLSHFTDVKTPLGDFSIGMRGNIKGVEWTIIGWVSYKTAEFPSQEWSEFFLYSPTHGYAWLFEEDDKLYFSIKVRDFDILSWQDKKTKTVFYNRGHYIQKEEPYKSYVEYAEGELNFIAKFGDKFTTWDYNGAGYRSLSIEQSTNEIEVYHTIRLQKEDIYHSFGLKYTQKSKNTKDIKDKSIDDIHKDTSTELEEQDKKIRYGFWILFLLLSIVSIFSLFSDKIVYKTDYSKDINQTFTIDTNAFLSTITLSSRGGGDANNKIWLYKDGKKIFYIDRDRVFFDKKPLWHTWDEDAIKAIIYLKLDKGKYRLVATKNPNKTVSTIEIKQRVIRLKHIIPVLILLSLVLAYRYLYIIQSMFQGNIGAIFVFAVMGFIIYTIFGFEVIVIFGIFGIINYAIAKAKGDYE